jgi:hypothetical protein
MWHSCDCLSAPFPKTLLHRLLQQTNRQRLDEPQKQVLLYLILSRTCKDKKQWKRKNGISLGLHGESPALVNGVTFPKDDSFSESLSGAFLRRRLQQTNARQHTTTATAATIPHVTPTIRPVLLEELPLEGSLLGGPTLLELLGFAVLWGGGLMEGLGLLGAGAGAGRLVGRASAGKPGTAGTGKKTKWKSRVRKKRVLGLSRRNIGPGAESGEGQRQKIHGQGPCCAPRSSFPKSTRCSGGIIPDLR